MYEAILQPIWKPKLEFPWTHTQTMIINGANQVFLHDSLQDPSSALLPSCHWSSPSLFPLPLRLTGSLSISPMSMLLIIGVWGGHHHRLHLHLLLHLRLPLISRKCIMCLCDWQRASKALQLAADSSSLSFFHTFLFFLICIRHWFDFSSDIDLIFFIFFTLRFRLSHSPLKLYYSFVHIFAFNFIVFLLY